MLARSLVAVLLSIPAAAGLIGLLLAVIPADPELKLPLLLMTFPLWVTLACLSYMRPTALQSASLLLVLSLAAFALLALMRFIGVSSI